MLNLFSRRPQMNVKKIRETFHMDFFSKPEHHWILESRYIKANFEDLFDKLPAKMLLKLMKEKDIIFVPSNGYFSCALNSYNKSIVMIFPELMSLLKSTATNHALAVLLHEIGHIILEHTEKNTEPLNAQVEADMFACELGLGEELESFLHEQDETEEKRVRIAYVTSYLMGELDI